MAVLREEKPLLAPQTADQFMQHCSRLFAVLGVPGLDSRLLNDIPRVLTTRALTSLY
jgi:hypothetical protein